MSKISKQEREEARELLRQWLKPGKTVWTVLRHVSRSGMSRDIDAYQLVQHDGGEIDRRWLSRLVATAIGASFNERREAVTMGGCGMDMGFALVYELSYALYPDGFGCVGKGCPNNDHHNGDRDFTPHSDSAPHWHQQGGYALQHRWL